MNKFIILILIIGVTGTNFLNTQASSDATLHCSGDNELFCIKQSYAKKVVIYKTKLKNEYGISDSLINRIDIALAKFSTNDEKLSTLEGKITQKIGTLGESNRDKILKTLLSYMLYKTGYYRSDIPLLMYPNPVDEEEDNSDEDNKDEDSNNKEDNSDEDKNIGQDISVVIDLENGVDSKLYGVFAHKGKNGISIDWNESKIAHGYSIYRNGTWYAQTFVTHYVDTNFEPGVSYDYRVIGFNEDRSEYVEVGTANIKNGMNNFVLNWDVPSDIVGHSIYKNGEWYQTAIEGSFNDYNLEEDVKYWIIGYTEGRAKYREIGTINASIAVEVSCTSGCEESGVITGDDWTTVVGSNPPRSSTVIDITNDSDDKSTLLSMKSGENVSINEEKLLKYSPRCVKVSYNARLGNGFNNIETGKMPLGYMPRASGTGYGGVRSDGTNGWSTRIGFETSQSPYSTAPEDGFIRPFFYTYHTDQGQDYGDQFDWDPIRIGEWYNVDQTICLNTVGNNDGYLKAIVDGKVSADITRLNFTNNLEYLSVERILSQFFHGGVTPAPNDAEFEMSDVRFNTW